MISVIIPVYRESPLLEDLILFLKKDPTKKEIIVTVDCPTRETKKMLSRIKGLKTFYSAERRGKSASCNLAVKKARSEKLVFLDDDVLLGKGVLDRISRELERADLVEVKKEIIRDSLKSRLTYAEYVLNYITIDLISKNTDHGLINGAAFGVRKKVFNAVEGFENCLTEDMEFSLKVTKEHKYKFLRDVKVKTKVDRKTDFWEQRKRWVFGTVHSMEKHPEASKKIMCFSPLATFAWMIVSLPFLLWLPLVLLLQPIPLAILFLFCFSIYYHYGKSLGYSIKIEEYLLYFLVGSAIRAIFMVYGKIVFRFFPGRIKHIDNGWVR